MNELRNKAEKQEGPRRASYPYYLSFSANHRSLWKEGSYILIYSRSKRKWISGQIEKIYGESGNECMTVRYNRNRRKRIQRNSRFVKEIPFYHPFRGNSNYKISYHDLIKYQTSCSISKYMHYFDKEAIKKQLKKLQKQALKIQKEKEKQMQQMMDVRNPQCSIPTQQRRSSMLIGSKTINNDNISPKSGRVNIKSNHDYDAEYTLDDKLNELGIDMNIDHLFQGVIIQNSEVMPISNDDCCIIDDRFREY